MSPSLDSLQTLHPENSQEEPNPWSDSAPTPPLVMQPLQTPSPGALDISSLSGEMKSEHDRTHHELDSQVPADTLDTFDPLAHQEEQSAREAWANAEGHPPPIPPPMQDSLPREPERESGTSGSTSTSTFPSFSSFARSFALPSLPNMNISLVTGTGTATGTTRGARPQSIDTATLMTTPIHPAAFATQQDTETSARGSPKIDAETLSPHAVQSAPRRENPSQERGAGSKGKDPPFDFQKFLDQMKSKSAEPVARYLRSFLNNFVKRTFTVTDQVKLINDFLSFISQKMRETDIWKSASDVEFDNAMEGMEKLVMNRLYDVTFTPQMARSNPPRPITTDDLERDRVLSQRTALFEWIQPAHLDVPTAEGTNGFLLFASKVELVKINHYKAPRDKLICILNCCKVIFGLIRHMNSEESADTFVPLLIYVVLKANPENLLSNVEFISRFRNPLKLQSEAGYYLSSLMGAVSFIETMDHTSLSNITQEEFEKNVEHAVQALAISRSQSPPLPSSSSSSGSSSPSVKPTSITPNRPPAHPIPVPIPASSPPSSLHAGEESATPLSLPSIDARRFLQRTGDSLSKPLNAIGRIFSDALDGAEEALTTQFTSPQTPVNPPPRPSSVDQSVPQTPYKPWVRRSSPSRPAGRPPASHALVDDTPTHRPTVQTPQMLAVAQNSYPASRTGTPTAGLDIPGLQAEIDAAHTRAADAARGTLIQIFPAVDQEVIEWVLEANDGDLGRSIEALLEIGGGGGGGGDDGN
ncbi:hypothetical protein BGY98DRAFT_909511 [Russula aff. rugulosa BPL654]|nr:hypothetical protein BGY98DRAFT_909511 [Russula aff. rugulosa BPL654]